MEKVMFQKLCEKNYRKILFVSIGIFALLLLNLSGGIVGKYIATSTGVVVYLLLITLFLTYGLRALAWMILGKQFQLSYVYPFMSLNFVLAAFIGHWLFGESISTLRIAGSLFLMTGVLVLSTSPAMETNA